MKGKQEDVMLVEGKMKRKTGRDEDNDDEGERMKREEEKE